MITDGCGGRQGTPGPTTGRQAPVSTAASPVDPSSNLIRFIDIAEKSGIAYIYPKQPRPLRNLEAFGCGCAALDYDDDGWMDILLVTAPHPILYHNRGDGTFEDVTVTSGLAQLKGDWKGCAAADFDSDGKMDLMLLGYRRRALLRNVDGPRFVDVTKGSGLEPSNRNHWGTSAGFMDLDGSGNLSLVLLNYVIFGPKEPQYCEMMPGVKTGCPPATYEPEFPELWKNDGAGRFTDITASSGLKAAHGKSLVVAFADMDDDGKIDFYIGNDGTPAELMRNLGHLKFRNIGKASGAATGEAGSAVAAMGADWGDFDRDGRPDLAVSAFSNESYLLLRNAGHGLFEHFETAAGIAGPTLKPLGFGTKWLDFDNDGWPDLIFVNGHVYDISERIDPNTHFYQPIMLFHNVADHYDVMARRFVDLTPTMSGRVAEPILGRGLATADFDNDGRMDALAIDYEGHPLLLHNESQTPNHWVGLDLRGIGRNRFAYGAIVTARSGAEVWTGIVSPASSYLSSSDPRIHFGLGPVSKLESVSIRWPDGRKQEVHDVVVDKMNRVEEGRGVVERQKANR